MPHRVFLAYARADEAEAERLRRRLNSFRVRDRVAGLSAADRLDVVAGAQSGPFDDNAAARLEAALAESEALIVLCSPDTAADPIVNRAIDVFSGLGRLRRIFPVIAAGAPDALDFERDFFPPALAGRGLLAADLRDFRRGDAVVGDGPDGGVLKLLAALSGIELHRLVQDDRKRQNARIAMLSGAAGLFAAAAVAAAGYGVWAQRNATEVEAQRQVAVRNALQAAQSRDEALAAIEAQGESQARADANLQRSRERLTASIRNLGALSTLRLEEIGASASASPANLSAMRTLEDVYWNLAEASPYLELPPDPISTMIERIASTYELIGRADDARRVTTRFARLNRRIAAAADADPAWRSAHAGALLELAGRRQSANDSAGQISALSQAAQITEPICVEAPEPNAAPAAAQLRANACMRFASIALARARAQASSDRAVDTAGLERARLLLDAAIGAYPDNSRLQANGVRLRQQVDRALARQVALTSAAAPASAQ